MIHAVLLAAGRGSRFGGEKLLAPLGGRPLVTHAATTLAQAIRSGVLAGALAVIPAGDTALITALAAADFALVENPDAAAGIASSIQRGLAALASKAPEAKAALIVLADQPGLRGDVIGRLIHAWMLNGQTARPRYAGAPDEPGHPVLLDRRDWPLAERLTGDEGLRVLLAGARLTVIDVPGINPDVDTPADLRRLEDPR